MTEPEVRPISQLGYEEARDELIEVFDMTTDSKRLLVTSALEGLDCNEL